MIDHEEYVNTLDVFGDDVLTDAILTRSFPENFSGDMIDDKIIKVGAYSLYGCNDIVNVYFPLATVVQTSGLHLCYMVPIEEEKYPSYMADLKAEDKRRERERRCLIESPKTGQLIMCPESNRCYGCPNAGNPDMPKCSAISIDALYEKNEYELPDAAGDCENEVLAKMTAEDILNDLESANTKLARIFELRLEGYEPKEISEILGIKRSTLYDDMKKIAKIAGKYINL